VYLTADPAVRAARRSAQDTAAGRQSSQAEALASVDRRDRLDSTRAVAPLKAADDAVHLDTTELSIDQVLVALSELAGQRGLLGTCAQVTR
ncbi:(d)CMP kinase, partial [Bradyrhizobium sp. BRP20]